MTINVSFPAPARPMLLSAREAAEMLSISERTLWDRTAPRGLIPCVRIGRRVLYSIPALIRFIQDEENKVMDA